MKYTENAVNILTVKFYKGVGRAWVVKNLKGNESVNEIVSLLNEKGKQDNITVDDFESEKTIIKEKLAIFGDCCDGLLAIGDNDFPTYRGEVKESEQPIYLFYKGNVNLLDIHNNNIAVIGLLNPDKEIEVREKKIVELIAKQDIAVVSGLALGCDSVAHRQAIISGKTIAILPSPLNDILPAKNRELAYEIVDQGGLLVTEYYENFKSKMELSSRYKERDRLQALFSDTIILAASYSQDSAERWNIRDKKLDSGARLAMEFARNYNIPRAVMYNEDTDANNPMFDLNRQLTSEDKDVVILTKNNLSKIINNIHENKKNKLYSTQPFGLFD